MTNKKIQMPSKILIEESTPVHGVFSWGPLEQGYVYTLGNALRRVLLSSLRGYAITKIKLPENVPHQFGNIPGVTEDLTDIILNLKKVRFKKLGDTDSAVIRVTLKDKTIFKAGDIQHTTTDFEILNPDLVICKMDESANFELQLTVEAGRGFSLANDRSNGPQVLGEVDIDAMFSPVTNVSLKREDKLVGSKTDYEKLVILITTDRSITPEQALREAAATLREHFALLCTEQVSTMSEEDKQVETIDQEIESFRRLLETPSDKLGLSQRIVNSLKFKGILTLGDIVSMKLPNFMKFKNLGKKSMEELEELLRAKKLTFGMDIGSSQKKN
ncbi:MAG: DNA-directed RNA polymerase subunit alpha [Bacteroidota bacterium]